MTRRRTNFNKLTTKDSAKVLDKRFMLFVLAVIVFSSLAVVVSSARISTVGGELARLTDEKHRLQKEISIRKGTLARNCSLSEIERKAREELGMTDMDSDITFIDASIVNSGLSFAN